MKTAFLTEPGKFEIRELPLPEPADDEVLVRVKFCGICTLEQRLYSGDMKICYPIIPGHEVSGVVEKIGRCVHSSVKKGDLVAVDMIYRCHGCYYCRTGQSNLCENRFDGDLTPLGGFSQYIVVKAPQVFPFDESMSFEEAAFAEPVACCIRSLKKLRVEIAEDLLVIGAGPMGLMHLQVARAMGARVFVSDVNTERLVTAEKLGADLVINPSENGFMEIIKKKTGGRGVDACVVTSPALSALETAFGTIRKNGRVNIYTAYMKEKPVLPMDLNTIHRTETLVTGTEGRTEYNFQQAVRLLEHGRVNVKPLISMIYSLDEIDEAVTAASGIDTQRVLLEFD